MKVESESLSVAKGWGNPEVLWHFFLNLTYYNVAVLQKGCHLGQMLVNWMIWEMILPEEKGNFTFSDS